MYNLKLSKDICSIINKYILKPKKFHIELIDKIKRINYCLSNNRCCGCLPGDFYYFYRDCNNFNNKSIKHVICGCLNFWNIIN